MTKRQAKKWLLGPHRKLPKWIGWGAVGLGFWPWARHSDHRIPGGVAAYFPNVRVPDPMHAFHRDGWAMRRRVYEVGRLIWGGHPHWISCGKPKGGQRIAYRNSPAWRAAWASHAKQWGC